MTSVHAATPGAVDPLLVPQVHEVLEARTEFPGVVTLRVAPLGEPPRAFLPAQIGMVGAFGIGEAAISISSATTDLAAHEYTIRRAGAITTALTRLQPGDQLWVRGPFGRPWDLALDGRDVVIAAGGLGVAPLRSAIYELLRHRDRFGEVVAVIGARSPELLLYADEYPAWRAGGIRVVATIDRAADGWGGPVGFVPEVVATMVENLEPARTGALTCGPDVMMQLVAEALIDRGVAARDIQLTLERNMQCGNGLCGHCQLGSTIVCRDGPVVRYPSVAAALAVAER
ncbi:FAD/NAD(P)-binding protein [Desertimonas flava]|jgi:NAD(P)H-flavin reductase|uniref:FAD/NAD(P)-binding protein n=1 Tax=Desertimonas flava TaxID=2064846 RepID=UPI000E344393|nr:FAD/NAD(P)-binding protein [Desertimonas flava]